MAKKLDSFYLKHMQDAINQIFVYAKNLTFTDFESNKLIQDGVIRQIMIIGEATKNIKDETRNSYQNIPWKDIAGMRDKLIHAYFGVDLEAVWAVVKEDLPKLLQQIDEIIAKITANESQ